MKHPEISVVIPCYKEAEVIAANVRAVHAYLRDHFDRHEIIVVTDGSPDGTQDIVDSFAKEHLDFPLIHIRFPKNLGKGAAVKAGILKSSFDPVLFVDADLTIPIEELEEFVAVLDKSDADMVIASRLASGARPEEPTPWYRTITTRGFHLLQIFILGSFEFSDTQCGFKLFRRKVAFDLFKTVTIDRFAFDAELLFIARKRGYRVTILPVTIRRDPRNTNVRIIHDSIDMFFALLRIRCSDLSGRYEKILEPSDGSDRS
ncbi:MAG TPA: dolichyl-phosphate beta-glucosyltransferase [Candidatus Fimivivens sp.]|nr:dolichyl-phosphate beta-glucosyltransferase [Candidatus Fimivivens sp.]